MRRNQCKLKKEIPISMMLLVAIAFLVTNIIAQQMIDFDSLGVGTVVFEQLPGVRFPGTPRVVLPTVGTASGTKALSNARPGEEFNTRPLVVEFLSPQQFVKLKAGLGHSSASPVQARLRAFDTSDTLVGEIGPISIGPGPTAITTEMQVEVEDARIVRIELEYSGAFAEVIDNLEFSTTGPSPAPDTKAPIVKIVQPSNYANLTGEMFILEAEITENRKLRSLRLSISNDSDTESFELSFYGVGPVFRVGPVNTGPLAEGRNTIKLTAEDFGGNVGSGWIQVTRVPIAGTLVILAEEPIEIRRAPGDKVLVSVELQETFPGSLDGRKLIIIEAVPSPTYGPKYVYGQAMLRDPLNDPEPRLELKLNASRRAPFGLKPFTVRAKDEVSGRVLSSVTLYASITPASAVDCIGNYFAFYSEIPLEDLTRQINTSIDLELSGDGKTVETEDSDIGITLIAFPPHEKYTDLDEDGHFSIGDAVYADETDQGVVSVGDERLANAPMGGDGSIVEESASDLGTILIAFEANERFSDLNNNGNLDGNLLEPIYWDTDSSENVTADDVRLANSIVVPDLRKLTNMTVRYLSDPYGVGRIWVEQKFVTEKSIGAEIAFFGDLRLFLDPANVNADRIRFEYRYTHVRADTGWGVFLDPHLRGRFEDGFRQDFVEPFCDKLGPAIAKRIRALNPNALLILEKVYINDREFGLGFCVPVREWRSLVER